MLNILIFEDIHEYFDDELKSVGRLFWEEMSDFNYHMFLSLGTYLIFRIWHVLMVTKVPSTVSFLKMPTCCC